MEPIHSHTVDSLNIIIQDLRLKMIRQIASKLEIDQDEMIEKYCSKPVNVVPCKTIQVTGIAVQDGPVFVTTPPPVKTRKSSSSSTSTRTTTASTDSSTQTQLTDDELITKYGESKVRPILNTISMASAEIDCLLGSVGERIKRGEIFDKDETRVLLKPVNAIWRESEQAGLITIKQRSNHFNKHITNVLHGADISRYTRLRNIARSDPHKFFDTLLVRVKNIMIQNITVV